MNSVIDIAAVLLSLSALFAYVNHRFIGLPTTIGVMVIAMLASVLVFSLSALGFSDIGESAQALLSGIDFNQTLLHGMLSFLLFAGALHVSVHDLQAQRWLILSLATVGVLISTFLVGTFTFYLLDLFGLSLPYLYCLLFGALISPTDPIAVMATVKRLGVSKELETTIAGESLFNDGMGVVVFSVLLLLLNSPEQINAETVLLVFAEEALGGIAFGLVLGALGFYLLRSIDNYKIEVLITLALVMGGYSLAMVLHTSGPIAVVVAGLFTGSLIRERATSANSWERIDEFWEMIDEILNVVLFALIGLELLILPFETQWGFVSLLLLVMVVGVRVVSVGVPIRMIGLFRPMTPHLVKILVWGGLRGGISVALALSLPDGSARDLILFLTYVVVIFSILVQGLTIGPLIKRLS